MRLTIQVGEPRGFDAGNGTNAFTAEVIDGLSGSREVEVIPNAVDLISGKKTVDQLTEHWFAVSCAPVRTGDSTITSLLFIPRYKSKKSPLEMLAEGARLVFNGIWRQDGADWDASSVKAAQEGGIEIGGMIVANAETVKE